MPEKPLTIATYAAGASLAAITLVYVFGPTFFLDEDAGSNRKSGVVGLSNPANDCFINSVLQALAGLGDLRVYLIKEIHRRRQDELNSGLGGGQVNSADREKLRGEEGLRRGLVTQALKDILDRLNERPIYKKTITARDFVASLEVAFGIRLSRRQQDAQELLQVVAERLCDEYHAGLKSRRQSRSLEESANLEKKLDKAEEPPDPNTDVADADLQAPIDEIVNTGVPAVVAKEIVHDDNAFPFEGKLESIVECETCHFKPKPSMSTFVTLTLNVPQQSPATLDSCLDNLLKLEHIDDYKCDRCRLEHAIKVKRGELERSTNDKDHAILKDAIEKLERAMYEDPESPPEDVTLPDSKLAPKRRISKYAKISTYPKILAIHLSRSIYASYSTKNTAKVKFPEYLPLGGFDRKQYKLLALIIHHGGHNSGHYETFRRQIVNIGFSPNAFDPSRTSLAGDSRQSSSERTESISSAAQSLRPSSASTPSSPRKANTASVPATATDKSGLRSAAAAGYTSALRKKQKAKTINKWWRISDDKIKECNTSDVLAIQRDAYLLFYELDGAG